MNSDAEMPMQTIRVPRDVLEALKPLAKAAKRSVPKELEHRLRQSLEEPGIGAAGQASEWATALGLLVTRLAHKTAQESQSADEALATMGASASAIIEGLLEGFQIALGSEVHDLSPGEREAAIRAGHDLAMRVRNAHAPPSRPRGNSIEDRWAELAAKQEAADALFTQPELLDIQAKLLLTPEFLRKIKRGDAR